MAIEHSADSVTMLRVAPVTHSPQNDLSVAQELPLAVKRHLGLEGDRS
jgi:hypothetical protein